MEKYKTIMIDPPWPERGGGKIKRGADRHYALMKIPEIIDYLKEEVEPVIADDAHLYLWTTNNYLVDALKIVEELGFRYITLITWMKDRMGLGQYYRGLTEHCIFAVRGRLPYRTHNGKRAQGKTGFIEPKREHSRKPEQMYEWAEIVSYKPRLEVFARYARPGWDAIGLEAPNSKQTNIREFIETRKKGNRWWRDNFQKKM